MRTYRMYIGTRFSRRDKHIRLVTVDSSTVVTCYEIDYIIGKPPEHVYPTRARVSVGPIKPSIAQLEERGTVICNPISVLSQGRWFDPGSKDVLFLKIFVFHYFARSCFFSSTDYRALSERVTTSAKVQGET